ncbi:MAG: carbohydrate ABC transporter permease [Acidimicrobiales bacterium]
MSTANVNPPRSRSARAERRKRTRLEDEASTVPIRLYGLRKGTVTLITALCVLFSIFTLAPIAWIVINSTKTQANIFQSFGFWFARPFEFFHNFSLLFQDVDGQGTYIQWMGNTALYAVLGGVGATFFSALGGYGFARFDFRGSKATFYVVLSALLVPVTAITLPLYLVYAKVGLINSIWGMVLPSMVSPVGVYLMSSFIKVSVPKELLDAARVDGAGEVRIFFKMALPLMVPGLVTVLLISVVAVWNNYFLPLIIFSKSNLYPITVGLGNWSNRAQNGGSTQIFPLLVIGGLVTIIPLIVIFLVVQRYWKSGLLLGSVTG